MLTGAVNEKPLSLALILHPSSCATVTTQAQQNAITGTIRTVTILRFPWLLILWELQLLRFQFLLPPEEQEPATPSRVTRKHTKDDAPQEETCIPCRQFELQILSSYSNGRRSNILTL